MCFHSLLSMTDQQLAKHFRVTLENMSELAPMFHVNAFTFPKTPVITNSKKNVLQKFNWGLIPEWAKDDEIKKFTLNAKVETIEEKPAFRGSIKRRCLIPANGFFEWQWLDPKGKIKRKFLINVKGEEAFAFAGLWSTWVNKETGEIVNSYTILTTEANELMAEIHNSKKRMPVIINHNDYESWLNLDNVSFDSVELYAEEVE
ncbi:MAG: SOS response-associated peptidase [Saprospiraceae bacterium]|nr:SOS response-associated peptidase [Saprospiraceae bacterium]